MSDKITLLDVDKGCKCIVKAVRKRAQFAKRLIEMGLGKGTIIEVERVAPLGDPIEIKVKGYHLSIRKDEARHIEVEKK